jgi:undecaprenyl diphosphate synthase
MDGNRRWARKNNLPESQGHFEGMKVAQNVIQFCKNKGITNLSLYLFSLENFNRSEQEKHFLFYQLLALKADEFAQGCADNNIRVRFVGDRSHFPHDITDICTSIEHRTHEGSALCVDLLFCYGGQHEIVAATQALAQRVKQGELEPSAITLDLFKQSLWTSPSSPPDLILRTGGMHRLSNFLLFQSAYAEFMVVDALWPEVDEALLENTIEKFQTTKRNFGV